MQKQEDEKLERRLHQVMEQIQPDEDAKDRMYLEIMRRASVAETPPAKPKPWYLRWQTSAGACTAALLCVVVVAAAVHGENAAGGTGQLDIVSPTVTTQASELPADTEQPDETETRPQTEITAAETGVTVHSAGNASAAAESSTVPAEDEIVSPEITVPQKPQQQETQPVVTTAAPQTNRCRPLPQQRLFRKRKPLRHRKRSPNRRQPQHHLWKLCRSGRTSICIIS